MKLRAVTAKRELGEGTRLELDFLEELRADEGVLVGNTARGYVLVVSENRTTETYPPRPFRVNIGAIHQYVYLGDGKRCYASELRAGDCVPIVRADGTQRTAVLGRIKKERRPFIRIETEDGISATLQDADSVHCVGADGACVPMQMLTDGDAILTVFGTEQGSHKGEEIDEFISEL